MNADHELLQFFAWEHLPPHLQVMSKPFGIAAQAINEADTGSNEASDVLAVLLAGLEIAENCEGREMRNKIRRAHSIIFNSNTGGIGHWSKDMVMRQLLEAKDCAVRSVLYKAPVAPETKVEHG